MRYVKLEKSDMIVTHVVKTECDFCKKICSRSVNANSDETGLNGASFDIQFGYGSKFDYETWRFDICDECAEKHLMKFKSENLSPFFSSRCNFYTHYKKKYLYKHYIRACLLYYSIQG